jgi:hypothetical protein
MYSYSSPIYDIPYYKEGNTMAEVATRQLSDNDVQRVYTVVNEAGLRVDEVGKTAGILGVLLDRGNSARSLFNKIITATRDDLLITPSRLLVVSPKTDEELTFWDAVKINLGDKSRALSRPPLSIPRNQVKDVTYTKEAPPDFRVMDLGGAALTFVHVEVVEGSKYDPVDFWVDTETQTPEQVADFQDSLDVWFGRRAP